MALFTGNGYLVANITALLAIPASDRPAFRVALLVQGSSWYEYDNTATTGGLIPADSPTTGRWFAIAREVLRTNRTYYVRTDGLDSNDGSANTSGGAFLTIQKAINIIKQLDLNGFTVNITCIGDFTSQGTINIYLPVGTGDVILQGDTSAITATKIKKITLDGQRSLCRFIIDAFEFRNTSDTCLALSNSNLLHGRISYVASGNQIISLNSSNLIGHTPCSLSFAYIGSGILEVLLLVQNSSIFDFASVSSAITFISSPSFSFAILYSEANSLITVGGTAISGAVSGTLYTTVASSNATIRKTDYSYQSST